MAKRQKLSDPEFPLITVSQAISEDHSVPTFHPNTTNNSVKISDIISAAAATGFSGAFTEQVNLGGF